LTFPFLDETILKVKDKRWIALYQYFVHPELDNFFVLGMPNGFSGLFLSSEMQSRIIAKSLSNKIQLPSKQERKKWIENLEKKSCQTTSKGAYVDRLQRLFRSTRQFN